jgi:hypothetical protein
MLTHCSGAFPTFVSACLLFHSRLLFFLLLCISLFCMPNCCPSFSPLFIFLLYSLSLFLPKYAFTTHFNPECAFTAHSTPAFSSFFCCCTSPPYLGFSSKLYPKCLVQHQPSLCPVQLPHSLFHFQTLLLISCH